MLNFLRKKKMAKRILWGLAIVIIPAFVLWGAGSVSKKRFPFKYIGEISGRKVPVDDFVKSLRDVRVTLFLNFFNQPETFRNFFNDKALVQSFAWEKLIIKEMAKEKNIKVADREVIAFIMTHPAFAAGGSFNNQSYKYILRNSLGMSARDFEESVRENIINAKFREEVVKDVTVSDYEVLKEYKRLHEKVKLLYLVIEEETKEKSEAIYEKGVSIKLSLKRRLRKLKRKERAGLEVRETELITRSDYIEGIGEAGDIVDIALALGKGEVSTPISVRKGFALIEPVECEFIDEEKFGEEKADLKAGLLEAKKQEVFQKWLAAARSSSTLLIDLNQL